jgi:serine/threonine protein kinase
MDWEVNAGDELGPGGRSKRYQAFLTWNDELLAPTVVKILRPDQVDDGAARRTIKREGELLRHIDHPYFLRLLAGDTDGPRPFIELEFLDGPRLSTLIHCHGILSDEQLYPLGRQLVAAVHHLHGRGLLHLDIEPRNVIMGPVPRLIDMSIARASRKWPRSGARSGPMRTWHPSSPTAPRWPVSVRRQTCGASGSRCTRPRARHFPSRRVTEAGALSSDGHS